MKGRILEASLAGCALLEYNEAPTHRWIPPELLYTYKGKSQAARVIRSISKRDAVEKGKALHEWVKGRYHPRQIYGSMLREVSLVVPTITTAA